MKNTKYDDLVLNYVPFPWEIEAYDNRVLTEGMHSFIRNYVRYSYVFNYLNDLIDVDSDCTVIDVGSFPGSMIRLLEYLFKDTKGDFSYIGIGLGFTEDYKEKMTELNAQLIETELDPDFINPAEKKEWSVHDYDLVLFLDAIEHLTNPINCLDDINKSLKLNGNLIITTDNICTLGNTFRMLTKGSSPNLHPLLTSNFYRGDWRPHFKEFSKNELEFYLDYCGYEVISHEYFERRQGDYYLNSKKKIVRRGKYSIKRILRALIVYLVPHLRSHQILHARKIKNYDELVSCRPVSTTDKKEWMQLRKSYQI